MSVRIGQRRIMSTGHYVTVKTVGPERSGSQGVYVVSLAYNGTTLYRSYGTVLGYPLTPCQNESHHHIRDCLSGPCLRNPGTLPHGSRAQH